MIRENKKHIEGIIFDVDGVIAETEDYHRQAYNQVFQEERLDIHWAFEDYKRDMAMLGGTKLALLGRKMGITDPEEFALRLVLKKRMTLKNIIQEKLRCHELVARPGIARLIHEASNAGVKIGAASITNKSSVESIIKGALGDDLFSRFEFIAGGDIVENKKPAPDIYILTVKTIGINPERTVAIEDTPHGLKAAQGAGLKCVITRSEYTQDEYFDGADLVVSDLGEPGNTHYVNLQMLDNICSR